MKILLSLLINRNNRYLFLQDEKNQILTTNVWLNLVSFNKIFVPLLFHMSLEIINMFLLPLEPSLCVFSNI